MLFPNISFCTKWSINKCSQNVSLFLRLSCLLCEHQLSLWTTLEYKIQHIVCSVIETSEKHKLQTKDRRLKQNFYKARVNFLTLVSITTHFQNNFRNRILSLTSSLFFYSMKIDLNMLQNCFSYVSVSICLNLHTININMYKELFNANKNLRHWIMVSPASIKTPDTSWSITETKIYLKSRTIGLCIVCSHTERDYMGPISLSVQM